MQFIYKGKKRFGSSISMLLDIVENNGIFLDEFEMETLVDKVMMDEIAPEYYKEGVLNIDMFLQDPDAIEDIVKNS